MVDSDVNVGLVCLDDRKKLKSKQDPDKEQMYEDEMVFIYMNRMLIATKDEQKKKVFLESVMSDDNHLVFQSLE